MIQIFENESFNEDYIKRLNAKELAYVTSESRLIMISMNICKRSAQTELYMANEKIHLMPRALALNKNLNQTIKSDINADIFRIQGSGLFNLWMTRAINNTLLKCIKTEESLMKNNEEIMITLHLLLKIFKVMFSLFNISLLILLIELGISNKTKLKHQIYYLRNLCKNVKFIIFKSAKNLKFKILNKIQAIMSTLCK